MSGFTVRKCGFCERRMIRKKQNTISCQVCDISFRKRCTQISGTNCNLLSRNGANCYCQSCFVKNVPSSEVNESPTNDQNQSRNSLANIIIILNSNKSDFYNSCGSIEVPFDDDNHHILINSKYFNINEHHFGILHLNIESLNKHIDGISNLISLTKLNFPIVDLSKHKIRLSNPINNISLPGYVFCFNETKSNHGGKGFFINEKYSYTKRSDLDIFLDKNLKSTFIEINLPKKRNFLCGCIYKHLDMSMADLNLTYLTPLLEKLNKEDKLCFLMDDFNIDLMEMDSKLENSQFYNTMCSYFFCRLFFDPLEKQKHQKH